MTNKFFIEIGSSDFDTLLPLAKQGWKGMVVEAVPDLINNLEKVKGVIYENVAVWDKKGTTTIQYYDPNMGLPEWSRGVGQIAQASDQLNYNRNPQWDNYKRTTKVPMVRLDDLITKHKIKKIDFLKVDIEGGERPILMDYSFKVAPTLMRIEIEHWPWEQRMGHPQLEDGGYPKIWEDLLAVPENKAVIDKLEKLGYKIFWAGGATTNWNSKIDNYSYDSQGKGGYLLSGDIWAIGG